jgi:DNA-binding NarL/FixJ family response regulator
MARISIADDHEGTRAILRVLLQHAGWEICGEAATNSEAMQKSIELKPDVLVKDGYPGVSNLEITREIARPLPATAIALFSFHDLLKCWPSLRPAESTAWPPKIFPR